jgi:hypothetical protein
MPRSPLTITGVLFPTIVGVTLYIVVSKLFPEKLSSINSGKDLRGGDLVKYNFIKKLMISIKQNRALKVALIGTFAAAGVQSFTQEIETLLVETLLVNNFYTKYGVEGLEGKLKVLSEIVKEYDLESNSKTINKILVAEKLSKEHKVSLLKIKLDFLINGEYAGKKRFVVVSLIALLLTVSVSGVAGLAIFLEALYQLFQEGKISKAVYEGIMNLVKKKLIKEPLDIEDFL